MARMLFNIWATFGEFEADIIRLRTREGMKMARRWSTLESKARKLLH